eukprot:bmy_07175T0
MQVYVKQSLQVKVIDRYIRKSINTKPSYQTSNKNICFRLKFSDLSRGFVVGYKCNETFLLLNPGNALVTLTARKGSLSTHAYVEANTIQGIEGPCWSGVSEWLWELRGVNLDGLRIFGALRTGAYMVYILMTKGLKHSVCDQGFYNGPVSKFWAYAFVLSKAPELGDTIFIILRKQKLIFLHWYHHITVLLYSWYSYKDMVAGGGWFMTMNYGVHSVMYSYYALRAAGFRVSRKFAMFITLSQITQMLMGCVVNYLVFHWMQHDQCHSHFQNIFWSSLMYLSYLVLFCHFFFEAYIGKMRKTTKAD